MSTESSSLAVFGQLSHYPTHWVQGVAQADLQAVLNLLLSLPEANLLTFLFLLDHLKR